MLTGVVTALVLIIALLAVPVTLRFRMTWHEAIEGDIRLFWLFGLVRVRIPSSRAGPPAREGDEGSRKSGRPGRSSGQQGDVLAVIRQKSFRRRIIRFVGDIWHALHKRNLSLRVRLGLGDPADTGRLWAVVGPVAGILSNTREASIEVMPEFLESTFEMDGSGDIRIIPLQMIYLTAGLLLSPPFWQGIRRMRSVDR